jgi:hypothetical protein
MKSQLQLQLSVQELESHLWEAVNILRGPVDAVCGENVYSRATLLLSQSSGALTDFANLKMVLPQEP